MRLYVLAPLGVTALCLLWIWFANRRPRITGAIWPDGMRLSGAVERPDVEYEGDLVLACDANFGRIRCRVLRIARGADVTATSVEAMRVRIDGRLRGVARIAAARRLLVRGELRADDVDAPRIRLTAGARATVLTVAGNARIERHPKAEVKGFFNDLDEMRSGSGAREHGADGDPVGVPG